MPSFCDLLETCVTINQHSLIVCANICSWVETRGAFCAACRNECPPRRRNSVDTQSAVIIAGLIKAPPLLRSLLDIDLYVLVLILRAAFIHCVCMCRVSSEKSHHARFMGHSPWLVQPRGIINNQSL